MTIGENIKRIRIQRGLTQAELGYLVGVADTMIRKYELGIVNPKPAKLDAISHALSVNVEVLKASDFNDTTAMQRLFQLFRQYDGYFDQDGNLQLRKMDLSSWKKRWKIYQEELAAAKQIKDEQLRQYAIEDAEDKFNWWMDTYNFPVNNSQDLLGGAYIGIDSKCDTKKMILEKEKWRKFKKSIREKEGRK